MIFSQRFADAAKKGGFSVIEMLVAVALFAVIMTIGVGSVLSVIDANRRAQTAKSVMNNLNFAMDHITRNIRTGSVYHCADSGQAEPNPPGSGNMDNPQSCDGSGTLVNGGGNLMVFEKAFGDINETDDQLIYRFNAADNSIEFSDKGSDTNPNDWVSLTAPEVVVERLRFYVTGADIGDGKQPTVTIVLQGFVEANVNARTDFNLQTTVTQRVFDI